ncbi:TetR/AcrR family transcriptional regulator C-terminal domain-containing protein [Pseudarthrobacter sp. AG30]|uniref:TetR/AcrR family transcriptional regulator C-terminal domain-containing protein n=1 Tax=Pseudarthrobacter sp. AG30 TaxID=2249742 RepID=UPI0034CE4D91
MGISRDHLAPVVNQHLDLLFRQPGRYFARLLRQRGWETERPISTEVRTYWRAALGAVLLSQAPPELPMT